MSNVRYYTLNNFLRNRHSSKVMKLSIDGGFTCPNRDGTLSHSGCIFCSSKGSGDFAGDRNISITDQMTSQINLLKDKWPNINKYIAYFQAYSNTYASPQELKEKYEEALRFDNVVGLAIGTRADCFDNDILDYLEEINDRTHLWVELGLQTIHEKSASFINRSHTLGQFENTVYELNKRGIEVVVHIILGIPGETKEDMLETARFISTLPLQGVKIHMLHVTSNSPLGKLYTEKPFELLSEENYVNIVGDILRLLPPHFVIHRLTGDGDKNHLLAPLWTCNKRNVLNRINSHLKHKNIHQGDKYIHINAKQ